MSLPPPYTGFAFPGLDNLHNDIYPAINPAFTPTLHQPGKVILITGAGRGIGRAIALQFAHAKVLSINLVARTQAELDEVEKAILEIDDGIKVHKYTLNVTDNAAVAQLAREIRGEEGRLDVLVNNAGATADWVPMHEADPQEWWTAMEVNLKGPYLFIQAFLPLLVATHETHGTSTHIINMTSIGAHQVFPTASSYMVSKLALLRLSEFVHAGYAEKGVICVGVHPGGVATRMSEEQEVLKPFLTDTAELCGGFVVWVTTEGKEWMGGRYVAATWDVDVLEGMRGEIVEGGKLVVRMVV